MAIRAYPHIASRRLGRLAAQLVGPVAFVALVLVGAMVVSPAAEAAAVCGDRSKIIEGLASKHDETPRASGLSADGGVVEVYVSPEGGWTILVTYPRRPTCVVAVGEAWQSLHQLIGQPS